MFSRLRAELITPRARFALDNIVTRIHPAPQGARVYLYARQYGPPGAIRHFDYRALGLMSTLGVFWALIFASVSITPDIFSVRILFFCPFSVSCFGVKNLRVRRPVGRWIGLQVWGRGLGWRGRRVLRGVYWPATSEVRAFGHAFDSSATVHFLLLHFFNEWWIPHFSDRK